MQVASSYLAFLASDYWFWIRSEVVRCR